VVHDVLEAFLRRLQKSDSDIDEQRFYEFADQKTGEYFGARTFIEVRYGRVASLDLAEARRRVHTCLANFIGSPIYSWIFMTALRYRDNWMIEPPGYGETRLNGLKAYCKMDFLLPAGDEVTILDWKTGKRDEQKHTAQVMGYAAAANANFGIPLDRIFPRIVYLYPEYGELEVDAGRVDLQGLFGRIERQTRQMQAYCADVDQNTPLPIEKFPLSPSSSSCTWCRYQELCFPDRSSAPPPSSEW